MTSLLSFFRNFSSRETVSLSSAALVLGLSGIASRFLGFIRDRLLASSFGAGDTLDAYYAAFRIPDLIYNFLVIGALSAAFIPVFTSLIAEEKKKAAWRLAGRIFLLLMVSVGVLSILGMLASPFLLSLLAPGFDEAKRELAVTLTRIMFLSPILLAGSAVLGGVLTSLKRFLAYALAPIFYNGGILVGILVLVPLLGVEGLAWGVVLGAALHFLSQYPATRAAGFQPVFSEWRQMFADTAVRRVMVLMGPRAIGIAINQLSLLMMTAFASFLTAGSLAVLTFANNIQSVALGLVGVAFSVAAFPTLSLSAAAKKHDAFFMTLADTTRRILFFVLPISAAMIIFRAQFVRVLLGSGQFDWEDTILTFTALALFSISLFAQSLIPLFARAFFSLQNTKTPLFAACVSECVHISLLVFSYHQDLLSIETIAIAFSISALLHFSYLYFALKKVSPVWNDEKLIFPALKIVLATIFAAAVAQASKYLFALTTNELDTFIEVFLQLLTGLTIGGIAYVIFCQIFRVEELTLLRRFIWCKILRQPETLAEAEGHPEKGEW